eukprot:gene9860-12652_t
MHELVRSNDIVLLGAIEALLASADLGCLIADEHISALEGMIGAFPRRLLARSRSVDRGRLWRRAAPRRFAMTEAAPAEPFTLGEIAEDRLLGGRLRLLQPVKGHRAGSDAILLAAAIPELGEGALADFGAGVGTVGLCVALRQPVLDVVLVERDPELAALAARNAGLNGLDERVRAVVGTIGERNGDLTRAGLPAAVAWVAMNPPFFESGEVRASPVANRRAAHVTGQSLADWLKTARHVLKPGGGVSVIHRAEALGAILAGLETGFGAVEIRPIHAQAERPAIRVIVSGRLGSKKPAALLPALVLNGADGRFTAFSEALHRGEASLA